MLLENPGYGVLCTFPLTFLRNKEVACSSILLKLLSLFKRLRSLKTQFCCAAVYCLKVFLLPHSLIYVSPIWRNLCSYILWPMSKDIDIQGSFPEFLRPNSNQSCHVMKTHTTDLPQQYSSGVTLKGSPISFSEKCNWFTQCQDLSIVQGNACIQLSNWGFLELGYSQNRNSACYM